MSTIDPRFQNSTNGEGTRCPEPRAAYVHVPFCRHRCGYCNFTLVAGRDDLVEPYLEALERELSALMDPRPVDTLFIGGGTPTQLAPRQLARLLRLVRRWFPPSNGYEWSVEANPSDVTAAVIELLAEAGVTRLSLGVQSFDDGKLRRLERDHCRDRVVEALQQARPHFASLSIDLIFAVPGETAAVWERDLREAIEAPVDHVSCYGLTIERGTRFYGRRLRGELRGAPEELEARMYEAAIQRLSAAGFEHYEVSNFARPGHICRHNTVYWRGLPYFAAGPGAARYVAGCREVNHRSTTAWLKRVLSGQSPVAEREHLTAEETARERLVFGLRMLRGIERERFELETGYELEALAGDVLRRLVRLGLLLDDGACIRLSHRGLLVSDLLWPDLLAP